MDNFYKKQNGEIVFLTALQVSKETDRIRKENVKAAQKINPAKNAWAFWGKFNAKKVN